MDKPDNSQIPLAAYDETKQINASLDHIKDMIQNEKPTTLKERPLTGNEIKLKELDKMVKESPVDNKDPLEHSANETPLQAKLVEKERILAAAEAMNKEMQSDSRVKPSSLTRAVNLAPDSLMAKAKAIEEKARNTLTDKGNVTDAKKSIDNNTPEPSKKEKLQSELDALVAKKKASEKPEDRINSTPLRADKPHGNSVTSIKYGDDNDKTELDNNFRERYVVDQNNNYRWSFNNKAVAFQDKGDKIIVKGKPATVSEDVVKLLKSQGVTQIKVSGELEHKQRVWMAATERGIDVKGYQPTKEELKQMESMKNTITVLKKEPETNQSKDNENIMESHREAAIKAADKHLHPENKAVFVGAIMNEVSKRLAAGKSVPKVKVKERELEAER